MPFQSDLFYLAGIECLRKETRHYLIKLLDCAQFEAFVTDGIKSPLIATSLGQKAAYLSNITYRAKALLSIININTERGICTRETSDASDVTCNIGQLINHHISCEYDLSPSGNGLYIALFGIPLLLYLCFTIRSRNIWYKICFKNGNEGDFVMHVAGCASLKKNHGIKCYSFQRFGRIAWPALITIGIFYIFSYLLIFYCAKSFDQL